MVNREDHTSDECALSICATCDASRALFTEVISAIGGASCILALLVGVFFTQLSGDSTDPAGPQVQYAFRMRQKKGNLAKDRRLDERRKIADKVSARPGRFRLRYLLSLSLPLSPTHDLTN